MDARSFLDDAGVRGREAFRSEQRLLTFDGFLQRVAASPAALTRSTVQYLIDAIDSFGVREVPGVGGPVRRYRLFDAPWAAGRGAVFGQEQVQDRIVRSLRTAAEEGRLDRLLLLHGPNGSSKSSLVAALMEGMAAYGNTAPGALYRFHWIFPQAEDGANLGFGSASGSGRQDVESDSPSYALLPPEQVAARVPCELRDNPLLLLPPADRRRFLMEAGLDPERGRSLRHLLEGDLCPRCRSIHDALLVGHGGDLRRVLRHAQVERWFPSPRYRAGAVVVPPQGSVDARVREHTTAFSVAGLPSLLHHTPLLEATGDLVDAHRGILEFSDFLKRPIDLFKYLLHTTEKGTVSVGPMLLHLDLVMLATTNEHYLDAFKQSPDWTSFKARMELVEVPYLLEPGKERAVYESFIGGLAPDRHVAPHVLDALARFAVLTRLRHPVVEGWEPSDRELVTSLSPEEKLRLYDSGLPPDRLEPSARARLLSLLQALRDEFLGSSDYEGRRGASAREIRSVLHGAAADTDGRTCLTPAVVLRHLRSMLREVSVYLFLQFEKEEGYHDADAFADHIEKYLEERSLEDVQEALELVPEGEFERRLDTYVTHAVAFTQGVGVRNHVTGALEPPDAEVLQAVERLLNVRESPTVFRSNLVARIGAFGIDHPGERPQWRRLFPEILRALHEDYFQSTRAKVQRVRAHMALEGTPEFANLSEEDRAAASRAHRNLLEKFHYCAACAREAMATRLSETPGASE
jgi:predicted Ser/Thr protein kinase